MRWIVATMAAVAVLVIPSAALAYPAPSGDTSAPNYCPPRPADESPAPSSTDDNYLAQELADVCDRDEALATQSHTDAGTLDSDIQATTAAVKALTANGTTLDTVNADLAELHADLVTLDTDVRANGANGQSGQMVQLSPADRQLEADAETQVDGDLWIIVGAIVGCFAAGFILNRFFPA